MKTLISILSILLLFGCNTAGYIVPPKQHTFDKTVIVKKSYDNTWQSLISWMAENDVSFKHLSKTDGLIETEKNEDISDTRLCDCGEDANGSKFISSTGHINIFVRPIDGNTTSVTVSSFYRCYGYNYTYTKATGFMETQSFLYKGESTGVLESSIFKAIQ